MIILIPAYEPTAALPQLVAGIRAQQPNWQILVVDDGSGKNFAAHFELAAHFGATILTHAHNMGKGAALKTGFAWIIENTPNMPVITADADGQHLISDILKVAATTASAQAHIVLGGRRFTGQVPMRSQFGNTVSRALFRFATQTKIYDTQTGLRGFLPEVLPWLITLKGNRFEYEQAQLLKAGRAGFTISELPITTVYSDQNHSSHFRPVRDSLRVIGPVAIFCISSFVGFLVDTLALISFVALGVPLFLAVLFARMISAVVNFRLNRKIFIGNRGSVHKQAKRYAVLAISVLLANWLLLEFFVRVFHAPLLPAKIAVEIILFLVGYAVQIRGVFNSENSLAAKPKEIVLQSLDSTAKNNGMFQTQRNNANSIAERATADMGA